MTRILLACLLFAPTVLLADYANHPEAQRLLNDPELQQHYSRAELLQLLGAARKVPALIQAEQQAPERRRTWEEYRAIFIQPARIDKGVEFLRRHAAALNWAEQLFGAPPELITAIIGVETLYGGYTGPHRVLDSLATQGFDHPRRRDFFFSELRAFLLLCREHPLDPLSVAGSYAGAMGLPQFMPSNYRRLALDFDHDGAIDLWTEADAIGSAARYLAEYRAPGWQAGAPVILPIELRDGAELSVNSRQAPYRWAQLRGRVSGELPAIAEATPLGLLRLEVDGQTRHWLAFENFYAIMSYNPRTYYAMAVWELSQAIRAAARQP